MIYAITIVIAILILVAAVLVFVLKQVLHIAVALTAVFFVNSLLFLVLDQPILAILQLFIMVGGISTYLFIGVASISYSRFRHTSYVSLAALSVLIFALMGYGALKTGTLTAQTNSTATNVYSTAQIAASFSSGYTIALLYIITIMLFIVGLGAIMLLNRLKAMS